MGKTMINHPENVKCWCHFHRYLHSTIGIIYHISATPLSAYTHTHIKTNPFISLTEKPRRAITTALLTHPLIHIHAQNAHTHNTCSFSSLSPYHTQTHTPKHLTDFSHTNNRIVNIHYFITNLDHKKHVSHKIYCILRYINRSPKLSRFVYTENASLYARIMQKFREENSLTPKETSRPQRVGELNDLIADEWWWWWRLEV